MCLFVFASKALNQVNTAMAELRGRDAVLGRDRLLNIVRVPATLRIERIGLAGSSCQVQQSDRAKPTEQVTVVKLTQSEASVCEIRQIKLGRQPTSHRPR